MPLNSINTSPHDFDYIFIGPCASAAARTKNETHTSGTETFVTESLYFHQITDVHDTTSHEDIFQCP
jgi:hypothetical protein